MGREEWQRLPAEGCQGKKSSARRAFAQSPPQRLIFSRRRSHIPAAVPLLGTKDSGGAILGSKKAPTLHNAAEIPKPRREGIVIRTVP